MADTKRTLSDLLGTLPSGVARAITAQDIRDTVVSVYPRAIDVTNYGAVGDGSTDDTAAIQAAIDAAAAAGGGTVLIPGRTFAIGATRLVVPLGVGLQGVTYAEHPSVTASRLLCTHADAGLDIGARGSGSEGGDIYQLSIDGGNIATLPLYIGEAVHRNLIGVSVYRSADVGLLIEEAQNLCFIGLNVENCAGDGLVLDGSAGGLLFLRAEFNMNAGFDVHSTQTYSPGPGAYAEPQHIRFIHSIFERENPTSGDSAGKVRIEGGILHFDSCIFSLATEPTNAHASLITITRDIIGVFSEAHLTGCRIQGNFLGVGIYVEDGGLYLYGENEFRNLVTGIETAGGALGDVYGPARFSSVTTNVTPSPNTAVYKLANNVPVSYILPSTERLRVTQEGDSRAALEISPKGGFAWGDGTNPTNVSMSRTGDGKLGVFGSVFRAAGGAQINEALDHDGTTVGFFGVTPATRPAGTAEIKAALASLGLLTDGGASPLHLDGGKATVGEAEIDGDLNHDGSNVGFYGVAPVARPDALTQTYSTADRTLGAYTADDESAAYTGIDNAQVGSVYATVADLNALRAAYENLRGQFEDLMQFTNALVDDLQSLGLEQ